MTELGWATLGWVTLYSFVGAAIAVTLNVRHQHRSGRPLTARDHLAGIGVTLLWPLVLVAMAGWALVGWLADRVTPTRHP